MRKERLKSGSIRKQIGKEERPIRTMDDRDLPPGYMCERVNMSDRETE